jgi:Flp pilus assembly protein TadG
MTAADNETAPKNRLFKKARLTFLMFACCTGGTIAAMFAILAPVMIGVTGAALDISQSYLVRQRLCSALDASALAAVASSNEEAKIKSELLEYFKKNYPDEAIGVAIDPDVTVSTKDVFVKSTARYDTSFLRVFNIDEFNIYCETTVRREIQGLEVVMVLDNTGSMSTNNNIGSLRTAANSFVDILFERTSDPNFIKIGLVPYANSVRIGRYGLGMNPDGTVYSNDHSIINMPPDVSYTNNHNSQTGWYGCIVEHSRGDNLPNDHLNATYVPGSYGQLWRHNNGDWDGFGWDPSRNTNDASPYDVNDDFTGPWNIYMKGDVEEEWVQERTNCRRWRSNGSCREWNYRWVLDGYSWDKDTLPNNGCPKAYILPMSSNQAAIKGRIADMDPHGATLGNVGMMWGWRLISPEKPFTEGVAWDDNRWRKAIVMMTDGENVRDGQYNYFWDSQKNQIGVSDYNERFLSICNQLKAEGVLIYTITFYSNISDTTKAFYRQCATSPEQHYDAPTQTDLIKVFEKISRELSQIHIRS